MLFRSGDTRTARPWIGRKSLRDALFFRRAGEILVGFGEAHEDIAPLLRRQVFDHGPQPYSALAVALDAVGGRPADEG